MIQQAMLNQLTLGVGLKDDATFANFYAGNNQQLITELKKSTSGNGERVIYFCGTGGEGCTHLLQACCHEANQYHFRSVYLPLANISDFSPAILEGLETLDLICIDDIHKIAGRPVWEEAFFHAYNRIHDAGKRLIVTANVMPKALGVALPDVVSRLTWGMVFPLQPLSDLEKLRVLIMRAERRGMTLSEEVGKFILNHCPRHMSTLFAALDALDKVSLAAQRKLTIPFVKTVLQI
jgi:DnaA-homolog protein